MDEIPIFITNMGERISGVIHIPDKTPAPAIVFCHGFTGNRVEAHRLFVRAARRMSKEGMVAVRFDFRGSGESEGEFENMTISGEVSDLNAMLKFLTGRKEILTKSIGVLGLSMGGVVSILTAAQNETIRAVCTWSAPAELKNLSNSLGQSQAMDYIDFPSGYRIGRAFINDVLRHDILGNCSRISPRPILIVNGSKDPLVPVQHAHMLYEKAGEPKELVIIEDADHTFNRRDWEDKVIELTTKWFKDNLVRTY